MAKVKAGDDCASGKRGMRGREGGEVEEEVLGGSGGRGITRERYERDRY